MSSPGTPKASEAAVAAVQDALGCDLTPRQTRAIAVDGVRVGGHVETGCRIHRDQYGFPLKSERGCPVAVAAADAAAPHIAAQQARLSEAEWLIRTDHKLGRHDTYGADFTCKGCAWLRDGQ